MNRHHTLTIAALVGMAILLASTTRTAAATRTIRVLWVGNSYTAGGALPEMVTQMVNEGKAGIRMVSKRAVSGGKDFQWHYESPQSTAVKQIQQEKFDFVCLQNQSAGAIVRRQAMFDYAEKFVKLIRSRGGEPVFFCTWARSDRSYNKTHEEDWTQIVGAYEELAVKHKARIALAGPAWREALKGKPNLELYQKDGSHPSIHGAYLNMCVFYATLTGKSPVGLASSRTFAKNGPKGRDGKPTIQRITIDAATAKFLQETAWAVHQRHAAAAKAPAGPGK